MHPLPVAHLRISSRVAKQYVRHHVLNLRLSEKVNPWECPHHVLLYHSAQFLITKVLIPKALARLGQRIVAAVRIQMRIQHVSIFQLEIVFPMNLPLSHPLRRWWLQRTQKHCPTQTPERRSPQVTTNRHVTQIIQGTIVRDRQNVPPVQPKTNLSLVHNTTQTTHIQHLPILVHTGQPATRAGTLGLLLLHPDQHTKPDRTPKIN